MNLRDKIAETLSGAVESSPPVMDFLDLADAIIAALPECVPDLVWVISDWSNEQLSGRYTVQHEYEYNSKGACSLVYDDILISDHDTEDAAKAAANAHNRAAVMKQMGVTG